MRHLCGRLSALLGFAGLAVVMVTLTLVWSLWANQPANVAVKQEAGNTATPSPTPTNTPLNGVAYPPPNQTPATPLPKPTATNTVMPSPTPTPTRFTGGGSDDSLIWFDGDPQGSSSMWVADPSDAAQRYELFRVDGGTVQEAALSHNFQKIAFTASMSDDSRALWLVDLDGRNLQQLDQGVTVESLFWSRDDASVAYEIASQSALTGTGALGYTLVRTIRVANVATGAKIEILPRESGTMLKLLGWSSDGRQLYYSHFTTTTSYELWAAGPGTSPHRIVSLGTEPIYRFSIAPDGSGFIGYTADGLVWLRADGAQRVIVAQPGVGFTAVWFSDSRSVVLSMWDGTRGRRVFQLAGLQADSLQDLGTITAGGEWELLSLTPNRYWIAAYREPSQLNAVYLPTGTVVSLAGVRTLFVGWVPTSSLPGHK